MVFGKVELGIINYFKVNVFLFEFLLKVLIECRFLEDLNLLMIIMFVI